MKVATDEQIRAMTKLGWMNNEGRFAHYFFQGQNTVFSVNEGTWALVDRSSPTSHLNTQEFSDPVVAAIYASMLQEV